MKVGEVQVRITARLRSRDELEENRRQRHVAQALYERLRVRNARQIAVSDDDVARPAFDHEAEWWRIEEGLKYDEQQVRRRIATAFRRADRRLGELLLEARGEAVEHTYTTDYRCDGCGTTAERVARELAPRYCTPRPSPDLSSDFPPNWRGDRYRDPT